MNERRVVELLAPARNAECAMAAVDHGADAVYMGAPQFGARAEAGVKIEDFARAAAYAHTYYVRVYAAMNTILRDEELETAEKTAWQLYHAGADALIVQDMAFVSMNLPPIPLHASTQTDVRTAEKVKWLKEMGFSRAVLARELTVEQIQQVHNACDMPLEIFVHGALCVSLSGCCYASQHLFGRSANQGRCAQVCRLPFDMEDAQGNRISSGQHLLSLKDMNRSEHLERLLDAGATSLKIEGRLKDADYVKNITAFYRKRLDDIMKRRKEYVKASSGNLKFGFSPGSEKSFNRGFTPYFVRPGQNADIASPHTPKAIGEEVGKVKQIGDNHIVVSGTSRFANGDGLCFFDRQGTLKGFRVNRVENKKIFPHKMPELKQGITLFRNYDKDFADLLARNTTERKIPIVWTLGQYTEGLTIKVEDADGVNVTCAFACDKQTAHTDQTDVICAQLMKTGASNFQTKSINVGQVNRYFVRLSDWAAWRRHMLERLLVARRINRQIHLRRTPSFATTVRIPEVLTYRANVMNQKAAQVYRKCGAKIVEPAYELKEPPDAVLMSCRYCVRRQLGRCGRLNGQAPKTARQSEPLFLVLQNGRRLRLEFDCRKCVMNVYADK